MNVIKVFGTVGKSRVFDDLKPSSFTICYDDDFQIYNTQYYIPRTEPPHSIINFILENRDKITNCIYIYTNKTEKENSELIQSLESCPIGFTVVVFNRI